MKQNRSVRSLLLKRKFRLSGAFTVVLCVLGGMLCRWAISLLLIKSPIVVAEEEEPSVTPLPSITGLQYTGVDDKVEVLDRLSFLFTGLDNKLQIVTEMYQEGPTLYVVPKPLIVTGSQGSNKVGSGVWGNILGGSDNQINSDNITIVGGEKNEVVSGNINATILGGKQNILTGGNKSPIIMVGGERNKAEGNKGVNVILGGLKNIVSNTKGVNIVGGTNNTISGGNNVIVGGSGVNLGNSVENVFVFSDGDSFNLGIPSNENDTFYLKVRKGLGLNVAGSKGGVESKGAVSFGEIDIDAESCSEGDLGVEGVWNGCLVGCTQASKSKGGKWEMLDQGLVCMSKCNSSSRCIGTGSIGTVDDYASFCTTGVVSTSNAYRCNSGELVKYKNVVFETTLIDSDTPCPTSGENKCIYRCNTGFHLTGDRTGNRGGLTEIACYRDCPLLWNASIKKHHNELVPAYKSDARCSTGNFYDNTGTKHENCSDYKETLVCSNGTWYIANSSGAATARTATGAGYTREHCQLNGYRCNTGYYDLTQDDITGRLNDSVTWGDNSVNDGKHVNGEKGVYKVCVDYNPDPEIYPNTQEDGESCTVNDPVRYRLVKCMSGYMTGVDHPDECRMKVKLEYRWRGNGGSGFLWTGNSHSPVVDPVTSGYKVDLDGPRAWKETNAGLWEFLGWNTNSGAHEGMTGEVRVPDGNKEMILYPIFKLGIGAEFRRNGGGVTGVRLSLSSMSGSCVMWNAETGCSFTGTYDFRRSGWIVDGWHYNSGAHTALFGTGNTKITITKNTYFYTITHKSRTGTFHKNGATTVGWFSSDSVDSCNYYNRETQCEVDTPTIQRSCWTVKGWNTDKNATSATVPQGTGVFISSNTDFYAITEKTLTGVFDANTGVKFNMRGLNQTSWTSQKCYIYNTGTKCSITLPEIATTGHYSAQGWTLYSGKVRNPGDVRSHRTDYSLENTGTCGQSLKFYAQVNVNSECDDKYKLIFAYTGNGGTSLEGSGFWELVPGETVTLNRSSMPKAGKPGWTFRGWNTNSGAMSTLSTIKMECSEIVVYPIFSRSCDVSFSGNGSSLSQTTGHCNLYNSATGCKIISPVITPGTNTPKSIGFSTGASVHKQTWKQNTGAIVYLSSSQPIHCDGTYYAQTKTDPKDLKIIFDPNGSTSYTYKSLTRTQTTGFDLCTIKATWNGVSQSGSCSTGIIFPDITPNSNTPTVIGWSTGAEVYTASYLTGKTATLTASSDLTFYAQTKGVAKKYKATFNANGATGIGATSGTCTTAVPRNGRANTGCVVEAPSITRANFNIRGWATGSKATTGIVAAGGDIKLNGNATYYAITDRTVTATFTGNGATATPTSKSCTIRNNTGGCMVTGANITRNSFTNRGWSVNKDATTGSIAVGGNIRLTTGATYYAITFKTVNVTFKPNGNKIGGGTVDITTGCTIWNNTGACIIKSPTITVATGFSVVGYNLSSTGTTNQWTGNTSKRVNNNLTLYAITSKGVTVTFKPNGNKINGKTTDITTGCTRWNGASTCKIITPTITASGSNTPTPVGYTTSAAGTGKASIKSNTGHNISGGEVYYAHTMKNEIQCTITNTKGDGVSSIGGQGQGCTIAATYNGQAQAKGCTGKTQNITCSGGYANPRWIGGSINTGPNVQIFLTGAISLTAQCELDHKPNTGETRIVNCNGLLNNAYWVNSGFEQMYLSAGWFPITQPTPTYTGNNRVQCSFLCKDGYEWDGEECLRIDPNQGCKWIDGSEVEVGAVKYSYKNDKCICDQIVSKCGSAGKWIVDGTYSLPGYLECSNSCGCSLPKIPDINVGHKEIVENVFYVERMCVDDVDYYNMCDPEENVKGDYYYYHAALCYSGKWYRGDTTGINLVTGHNKTPTQAGLQLINASNIYETCNGITNCEPGPGGGGGGGAGNIAGCLCGPRDCIAYGNGAECEKSMVAGDFFFSCALTVDGTGYEAYNQPVCMAVGSDWIEEQGVSSAGQDIQEAQEHMNEILCGRFRIEEGDYYCCGAGHNIPSKLPCIEIEQELRPNGQTAGGGCEQDKYITTEGGNTYTMYCCDGVYSNIACDKAALVEANYVCRVDYDKIGFGDSKMDELCQRSSYWCSCNKVQSDGQCHPRIIDTYHNKIYVLPIGAYNPCCACTSNTPVY